MPASSAFSVGSLNAFRSTRQTAMPSTLPEIAVFIALTISPTSAVLDPVHWNVVFSSAHASSMPYCVGTKNGFVVTWLTNTNRYFGVAGKFPAPAAPSSGVLARLAARGERKAQRSGASAGQRHAARDAVRAHVILQRSVLATQRYSSSLGSRAAHRPSRDGACYRSHPCCQQHVWMAVLLRFVVVENAHIGFAPLGRDVSRLMLGSLVVVDRRAGRVRPPRRQRDRHRARLQRRRLRARVGRVDRRAARACASGSRSSPRARTRAPIAGG